MTPPFKTPPKASYFFCGFHSATTSPFFAKLRMCNPSGFAGPQPKHTLFGAYFSCSDCPGFIVLLFVLFLSLDLLALLRVCNPSGFAGPQPKHTLFGAYFSCSDCPGFIVLLFVLFLSLDLLALLR